MNTKTGTLLAIAIAAALPFAGGAANKPERVREVAVAPAQSQSDPSSTTVKAHAREAIAA